MAKWNWSLGFAIAWSWAAAAGAETAKPVGGANTPYGTIAGRVADARGMAQAGVPVTIASRDGRFEQKVYTQSNGRFSLTRLVPGIYAAEVLLPTFLPFWKAPIIVRSGAEVLLEIDLRTLVETMELRLPENPEAAREEWKWVLRTGAPPRPILRFREETLSASAGRSDDPRERALRGTVQFWAGNDSHGFGSDPGLRTSFDMEYEWTGTSVLGIAGSAGLERGTPAASLRTAWNRRFGDQASSTYSATARQLFLPAQYLTNLAEPGTAFGGRVQSLTFGYEHESEPSARVRLHYGILVDTVTSGERMTRWSPFGRLTYLYSDGTRLSLEFTAATPRVMPSEGRLPRQKAEQSLAFPQLSSGDGLRPALEGGKHLEAAWEHQEGPRIRVQAAAFYDSLSDQALSLVAVNSNGLLAGALRDPFSNQYFLNGGHYSGAGARASLGANLSENHEVAFGYTYAGGLRAHSEQMVAGNSQALRELVRAQRGHSFVVKVTSTVPWMHTQLITSYRWLPRYSVLAPDPYDHGISHSDPYLNVVVLQPLPSPTILPGQFQAIADFSNLLAQGYLAVQSADGGRTLLFPSARSFRGGFNFIF